MKNIVVGTMGIVVRSVAHRACIMGRLSRLLDLFELIPWLDRKALNVHMRDAV